MALATKEEERNALAKIRKIVKDLGGEDSYLGMTFKGCFEQAEENIENDWGCCYKDSYDDRCREVKSLIAHQNELEDEVKKLKAQIEVLEVDTDKAEAEVEDLKFQNNRFVRMISDNGSTFSDMFAELCADANEEIIRTSRLVADLSENPMTDRFKKAAESYADAKKYLETSMVYARLVDDCIKNK